MKGQQQEEADQHEGAVEGDKATDPQRGNPNAQGMDDEGLPTRKDKDKIAQDRIGANLDDTQG